MKATTVLCSLALSLLVTPRMQLAADERALSDKLLALTDEMRVQYRSVMPIRVERTRSSASGSWASTMSPVSRKVVRWSARRLRVYTPLVRVM